MLDDAELDLVVDALAETELEVDTDPELVLETNADKVPTMLPVMLSDGLALKLDTETDISPEGV